MVAKVSRDEDNVGSWSYSLLTFSEATYGSFILSLAIVGVDEADDIMFLRFTGGSVWAFDLAGTPIVHTWTPDGANFFTGGCIDPINNRVYLMMQNDVGGFGETAVLREYLYDGTYVGVLWSETFTELTSCSHLAYHDGTIYYTLTQGLDRTLYSINTTPGVDTSLGGTHTHDGNDGQGAVDPDAGYYFAFYIAANLVRTLALPTPGGVSTFKSGAAFDTGVEVDRRDQKAYWASSQRSIKRANYDGSSEESVIDFPNSGAGTYICGISLGR
jgi:hypothetical protein